MKLYIILLVLSCGILADKEVPEAFADELSQKLIVEIQKRLGELGWSNEDDAGDAPDSENEAYSTIDGTTCAYQVAESTIIQTDESLKAGASFIHSIIDPPSRLNRESCQSECCKVPDCNLAVLKEKGDKYACYLFNCGNPSVCNFTRHEGFAAFLMEGKLESDDIGSKTPSDADKHEADLAQLTASRSTSTSSTAAPTTVAATTTSTTDAPVKELVQLFGECTENQDCAGGGTICLAGYCICDDDYHAQDGLCRKDCNKFQFKCANEGQPLTTPQCIAIYDACDNIKHCADGSDEMHCENLNKDTGYKGGSGGKHQGGDRTGGFGGNGNGNGNGRGGGRGEGWRHKVHGGTTEPPHPTDDGDFVDPGMSEPIAPPHHDVSAEHGVPDSKEQGNASSQEQGTGSDSKESSESKPDDAGSKSAVITEAPTEKVTTHVEPTTTATAPSIKTPDNKNNTVQKSENINEAIIIVSPDSSILEDAVNNPVYMRAQTNKTAVVVLAMGLAITALLLVFVGCRLRTVKRRIRRGRPLNSNEADYLINGMYL